MAKGGSVGSGSGLGRRTLLKASLAAVALPGATATAVMADQPDLAGIAARFASRYPGLRTALEVLVKVDAARELPSGPDGSQRLVPITGGQFRGPGLVGTVLPGGADRQRQRPDGIRELDAIYDLLAEDGTLLMVHNQAIVDEQRPPQGEGRYVRSVVRVTAPMGPHDWLNRRLLVGTLHSLRPERPFVFLRFHVFE